MSKGNVFKFIAVFAVCSVISSFCLGSILSHIDIKIHHDLTIRNGRAEWGWNEPYQFHVTHKGEK